jgi:uncharacterized protein YjbI with pentapeptide repeats
MQETLVSSGPVALVLKHPGLFYSACFVVLAVAALVWWILPRLQKLPAEKSGLRRDLSLFYTGSVIAAGVIGAIIQFQANIERDQQQQAITLSQFQQQQKLTLSAENAKRFDGAVKRLQGQSDLQALGAIYTLRELSTQEGFYWPSTTMLNAYLRSALVALDDVNSAAIVGALYILSTRDWEARNADPFPLDFSRLNLRGLHFSKLQLWGNDFQFSNLAEAILPGAKLEGADFSCANFEKADFEQNSLQNATDPAELSSKLRGANFRYAILRNVIFKKDNGWVNVENACFENADLAHADISGFDLSNVTGLTVEQINSTDQHPVVPPAFQSKPCVAFEALCKLNAMYSSSSLPAHRQMKESLPAKSIESDR